MAYRILDTIEAVYWIGEYLGHDIIVDMTDWMPIVELRQGVPLPPPSTTSSPSSISPKPLVTIKRERTKPSTRVTGKSAYDYFRRKYQEINGFEYPSLQIASEVITIKVQVIDWFLSNNIDDKEVYTFIDWCFSRNQARKVTWLPHSLKDYIAEVIIPNKSQKVQKTVHTITKKDVQLRKLELKEVMEYYGLGYYDNTLTKNQYFFALEWRAANESSFKSKVTAYLKRRAKYPLEVQQQLALWETDWLELGCRCSYMDQLWKAEAERLGRTPDDVKAHYAILEEACR